MLDKIQLTAAFLYTCCLLWCVFCNYPNYWESQRWLVSVIRVTRRISAITLIVTTLIRIWI
jgi:hypothetical protein